MNTVQQVQHETWNSFIRFAAENKLVVKHRADWRMVKPERGQIQGLPTSYGTLVATDGLLCYVQLGGGQLMLAHLAHWQKEPAQRAAGTPDRRRAGRPSDDHDERRTALLALLEDL